MPPNTVELESPNADSTRVGFFEAESAEVQNSKQGKPKRKLVQVRNFNMNAQLPEQGSWHYQRKKEILQKYPQIKELYGNNPWSFVLMLLFVAAQTAVGVSLSLYNARWWTVVLVSYTLGTYLSWLCMVLGHEGSHGLVFKNKALNKLHTIIAFLPVFLGPFGSFWSIEHMYHHQVVVDKMNRYGPQQAPFLRKMLATLLYISVISFSFFISSLIALTRATIHMALYLVGMRKTLFPQSYKLKPYSNFPQVANSLWFFINMGMLAIFNGMVYSYAGLTPIVYFFLSNGFCNGLHPLGMRQVQEHYMQRKCQPTNSVYSSLSFFLLNIGYHNEHHDFPTIPWNRLPEVRKMAPEFYNNLFYYQSYTHILVDFLTNPGIPYTSLLEEMYETTPGGNEAKTD